MSTTGLRIGSANGVANLPPARSELRPVPEAGALALWKAELARGMRTMHAADELRDAAVLEAQARDDLRAGMIAAANDARRAAAALLVRRFARRAA
jgi:hypothetical protein